MVKIMENPIKMDDLGVFPYFWKHPSEQTTFRNPGQAKHDVNCCVDHVNFFAAATRSFSPCFFSTEP